MRWFLSIMISILLNTTTALPACSMPSPNEMKRHFCSTLSNNEKFCVDSGCLVLKNCSAKDTVCFPSYGDTLDGSKEWDFCTYNDGATNTEYVTVLDECPIKKSDWDAGVRPTPGSWEPGSGTTNTDDQSETCMGYKATDACMNSGNFKTCQLAVKLCGADVSVQESCPLGFVGDVNCGNNPSNTNTGKDSGKGTQTGTQTNKSPGSKPDAQNDKDSGVSPTSTRGDGSESTESPNGVSSFTPFLLMLLSSLRF